jgi:hypothetical protein
MGVWMFFDFALLAAGCIVLALSFAWRAPNILMNMVFSDSILIAGMTLGIALIVTFVLSLCAITQKNHITIGLVALNWAIIADAVGVVIIGSYFWYFTLQPLNNFHTIYAKQTRENRIAVQDMFKCCGYFNASDLIEFGGNFCVNPAFLETPEFLRPDQAVDRFCVMPITSYADVSLMNAFTTVYGYMAVLMGLLLATLCVIKKRAEAERFRRIDLKRGGGGFV